ncbi:ABC transporter permease [Propionispira raffinosivorans]|uniref:ABC transporter permease n=1 Tax=Propionispira raffinosivorans TaxID=86959 RepID=UPI00035C2059|nr:FtsX-like permease family protein [Propionispira raffinosivorans]
MRNYKMFFKMIIHALLRRRSRMLIALLAVAIGATIISGLVTVYYDVPKQMGREFRSYGANMVLVPNGENVWINQTDLKAVRKVFLPEQLVGVAPFLYERIKLNEQPILAAGTDFTEIQKVSPYWQITGQWPKAGTSEILVGADIAEQLNVTPGQTLILSGGSDQSERKVIVAGVVRTGGKEEQFVFMNLDLMQSIVQKDGQLSLVQVSVVADKAELSTLIDEISNKYPTISPQLVQQVAHSEQTVLQKLQALVFLVTIVVLLLTLICVATTMMAVVTERRKEIGLKKALGADNKSIIFDFLGEGCVLGALGGLLGMGLGFAFAQVVSVEVFGRTIEFSWLIAIFSVLLSIVVTGAASLIPVKIATSVEPAIVLRGE